MCAPESPDGRKVLFYTSTARDGQKARSGCSIATTGDERRWSRTMHTEDAHRAACQQWVSKGRRVAFHDERNGEWLVAVVDVETGVERVLAKNRPELVGPARCGPGPAVRPALESRRASRPRARECRQRRDPNGSDERSRPCQVSRLDREGLRRAADVDFLSGAQPRWPARVFQDGLGGKRRPAQQRRQRAPGKLAYDLAEKRFLFLSEKWGHPSWHPDSKTIVETQNQLIRTESGAAERHSRTARLRRRRPSVGQPGRESSSSPTPRWSASAGRATTGASW